MPLSISSHETTEQKAPVHRSERRSIHLLLETLESHRAQTLVSIHQKMTFCPIVRLAKGFASDF